MKWTGIACQVEDFASWQLTCPCGVTAVYPLNGLPTVDTAHPCGHANHWTIRYYKSDLAQDLAKKGLPTNNT